MRTTLDISDDVLAAARRLAESRSTTIDLVVDDLVRKGLAGTAVLEIRNGRPVFIPPPGTPLITDEDVARALEEE